VAHHPVDVGRFETGVDHRLAHRLDRHRARRAAGRLRVLGLADAGDAVSVLQPATLDDHRSEVLLAFRAVTFGRVILPLRRLVSRSACRRADCSEGSRCEAAPDAAREAYSLYVERAASGANEADGPF